MSKLKTLNKETVSFVLLNDLNLPAEVIGEIVEIIWRSNDRLEEIQRANTACSGLAYGLAKKSEADEMIDRGVCPSCTWRGDVSLENGVCPQCDTNWLALRVSASR
jgi:hypothetical protein